MKTIRKILLTLLVIVALPVALAIHYALPRTIEVYVVDTQNKLVGSVKPATKDGTAQAVGDLDMMMIQTVEPNTDRTPHVFRNQDAWWLAKFNSYDLQTRAADAAKANPPRLVRIRYYGWRLSWISMLPNAISLKPVEPPAP